jgi:LCP family protein required for cell wall assembly
MGKHIAPRKASTGLLGWLKFGFFTIAVVVVGMIALVGVQSIVQKKLLGDVVGNYASLFVDKPQALFGGRDRIAILMLGVDYNYNASDIEFSAGARSDTIKAIALNFPTDANPNGSVSVISVPRDTDYTYPDGHEDKINSAYSLYNVPAKSAKSSEQAVARFLGLPGFDRYITLRIDAAKDLVDAIGGIDIVPDETMNYDDSWGHLHIHFIGGKKYHMNGDQAVSYSRFRHDACSDPCRIKRQDQVLRTVIAKLKNDKFSDLSLLTKLIGIVRRDVYTDMSDREALSIATAMRHVDLASVKTEQVPFLTDKDLRCCGNVLVADDTAKAALVKKAFLDGLPPAVAADPGAVAAVPPSKIRVAVENGSGIAGAASKVAAALQKQGFVVDTVRDADAFTYEATEIHARSTAVPLAGQRVLAAMALKSATVATDVSTAAPSDDVIVIVGRDYSAPEREASAVK